MARVASVKATLAGCARSCKTEEAPTFFRRSRATFIRQPQAHKAKMNFCMTDNSVWLVRMKKRSNIRCAVKLQFQPPNHKSELWRTVRQILTKKPAWPAGP